MYMGIFFKKLVKFGISLEVWKFPISKLFSLVLLRFQLKHMPSPPHCVLWDFLEPLIFSILYIPLCSRYLSAPRTTYRNMFSPPTIWVQLHLATSPSRSSNLVVFIS